MSSFTTLRLNEDELTSPSSDEKMDTGSESFRSQDTPNSVLSDFEDRDLDHSVLRLQNPDEPGTDKLNFNDSLITKMSNLKIDSPKTEGRPRNLGISPPRFSSTLTLTTNHPLMGLGSPDENFPDVIPKKLHKIEDEKDLSLSSIEDERLNSTGFYSPQRNTSKNNLYFTENFVTAESHILNDSLDAVPPDVARVDKVERRKIAVKFNDSKSLTPLNLGGINDSAIGNCVDTRITSQSTPKCHSQAVDVTREEYHTGVAEWCESPSHLRSMPNFQLPIEMSTSIQINTELESPDAISSSTPEDRSAYQALLDPYTGNVALRHTAPRSPSTQRRKIQLPPDDDRCSLDSVSACSMESEEEPPEPPGPRAEPGAAAAPARAPVHPHEPNLSDDDDTKRSMSTNTMSSCSEPIPEYSAAEELRNERAWLSVRRGAALAACDMKVIEPYKRVLSHGGYDARGAALIVFSACHLPDNKRADYTYVMDNLFLSVRHLDAGAAGHGRVRAGVPARQRRPSPPAHLPLAARVLQAHRQEITQKSEAFVPGAPHVLAEIFRHTDQTIRQLQVLQKAELRAQPGGAVGAGAGGAQRHPRPRQAVRRLALAQLARPRPRPRAPARPRAPPHAPARPPPQRHLSVATVSCKVPAKG